MSERSFDDVPTREILSALADGQADSDEVSRACGVWGDGPHAQATWRTYNLIGEVLRSTDASNVNDSDRFLHAFRARLAQEPVVLSPRSADSVRRVGAKPSQPEVEGAVFVPSIKRHAWAGPFAVAASFAVMVGALTVSLGPVGKPEGSQVARSGVGWAEGQGTASGLVSALDAGHSFSAGRTKGGAWRPLESGVDQVMIAQRPQPSAPARFSDAVPPSDNSFLPEEQMR